MGDIDLLVPREQYEQAVRTLQQLTGDTGHEDYLERHYQLTYGDITIEVHHHPGWCANEVYESRFQHLSSHYLQPEHCESIQINDTNILVPSARYNALYVFNHLLHHLFDGGIGIRQFVDWALVLEYHNSSLITHNLLPSLGFLRPWQIMGGILTSNLGFPIADFPFYREPLAHKSQGIILARIMDGGNFGQQLRSQSSVNSSAIVRISRNLLSTLRETAFLWTLFPLGSLAYFRF